MRLLVASLSLLAACAAGSQSPLVSAPTTELAARGIDSRAVHDSMVAVLTRAMRDSAFPGAVAIAGTRSGVIAKAVAGHLDRAAGSPVPDENTVWDMASLTKVLALTSAVMQLTAQGKIDLTASVQRYLPEWTGPWKDQVKVRDLLTHTAGLPAWRPLYKETETKDAAIRLVLSTPLEAAPNTRMVYSDLGAILMGEIVKRVSGESFDGYVRKHVFGPLGMTHTRFLPPSSWSSQIAPTEVDPWRQRHLRGEVHDENAYRLGGVSSHAGLFSTAGDLARFGRMMLNHGRLDGVQVLDSATIDRFTTPQVPQLSARGIGWETANGSNSGGHRMSKRAFGHTGFTGTSIWIDPERDVFVVLLSNRVNPTRENRRIGEVRISLADAVMAAIGAR
ncbi:MAG: beta-lactamase family protein [Gemmatimonadaceae bacterium]|nr:beta-lactamase family protein [Gemmatimonadaceae bacterium]